MPASELPPLQMWYFDECPRGHEEWLTRVLKDYGTAAMFGKPAAPDHCDPSCTSYDLAAMVMSDCGHSTNNERLLDRIAARIDKHVEKVLSSLPPRQVPDSIEPEGWYESSEQRLSEQRYCDGWNACRTAMLACAAPLTGGDERRHRGGDR